MKYPLAPNGVFWSWQGEGHLRGFPMAFVRLAGCSVGCDGCDTNYEVEEKVGVPEILSRIQQATPPGDRDGWVWITGGEPTDHDLLPLLKALKRIGRSTAVATSGVNRMIPPVDWLSVSPHSSDPAKFQQRYGNELKLVDGLRGLSLEEWDKNWGADVDFFYRYAQPLSKFWAAGSDPDGEEIGLWREEPASLERCKAFLRTRPRWALSRQDHHVWGVA